MAVTLTSLISILLSYEAIMRFFNSGLPEKASPEARREKVQETTQHKKKTKKEETRIDHVMTCKLLQGGHTNKPVLEFPLRTFLLLFSHPLVIPPRPARSNDQPGNCGPSPSAPKDMGERTICSTCFRTFSIGVLGNP